MLSWSPASGNILSHYGQDGVLRYQNDFRINQAPSFIYLAGSQVATHAMPFYTGSPSVKYHHTDALGSPVATTDATQAVVQRSEYEPFGALINRANDNRPGYTGHVMDAETGLTYMQQRYYDPVIGRFLSVDPVTADGNTGGNFNQYWYANNNPYKFTDPDGRQVAIPWEKIGEVAAKRGGQAAIASQLDSPVPGPGDVVGAIILIGAIGEIGYTVWQANQEGDAPALPDGLVGNDQRPRSSGNSVTSGTLSPDFGGVGDYDSDLGTLAGETRPAGPGDKAPPGAQIGENGIFGRENSSGGRSINIPANGDKPHEILHYPRKEK